MKMLRIPLLATALFATIAAVGLAPAFAETTPAPASNAAQTETHHHTIAWMMPGQLVDGRIAFLKTELKITSAQEPQWQQVAAAMRENARDLDQAIANARQHRGAAMNAVEQMQIRGEFAKLRADNTARLLAAFKPLYASLSPEQQQMANALMASHHSWDRGWRRHA
jgi:LTXXQ motif family protein